MAEYNGANVMGYDDPERAQSIQEPQGSGLYRTKSLQFHSDDRYGTSELEQEEPSEEMELAIAVLMNIIEVHDSYILVFIRNEECSQSQEVMSMIREVTDIHIETCNLAEMERNFNGFHQALERNVTIDPPPLVFNNGIYVGNRSVFLKAHRFHRVDIVLNPPEYPWYDVIIIGSSHGAQMIVGELKKKNMGLNVALVKIPSPVPRKLHSNNQRRLARYMIWKLINELSGSSDDPTTFWSHSTYDNLKEKEDLMSLCMRGNVDYYSGIVDFLSKDTITVYPSSDENSSMGFVEDEGEAPLNLMGMNYILCPGTLPKFEPFPGIEYALSLQNFISKGITPMATLIIGNTPEVFETAHALALGGGEVTIMTLSKRWLPMIEQWYVQQILHGFRQMPVAFVMIREIISVSEINNDEIEVEVMVRDSKKCLTGYYSEVVVDYTTIPVSEIMDLEKAEVKLDKEGKIEVNDFFQTSNATIYAFGSVARGHPTCPKFEMMAGLKTIRYIARGLDDVHIPNIFPILIRTPLELASVGATRKTVELKECEMLVINKSQNPFFYIQLICTRTKNWSGEMYLKKNDQVKGVHILGHEVCCLIAGVDIMIENGLTKGTLVDIMIKSSLFNKLPINRISFTSRKYFKDLEHRRNYMNKDRESDAEDSDASSIYIESWSRSAMPHASENNEMEFYEEYDETEWIDEDANAVSIDRRNCDEQLILDEITNIFAWIIIADIIAVGLNLYCEPVEICQASVIPASEHGASIVDYFQNDDDRLLSAYEQDRIKMGYYLVQENRRNSCPNLSEEDKLKCLPRSYSCSRLGTAATAKRYLNKSEAEDSNLNQEKYRNNTELVPKEIYYVLILVSTTFIMVSEHIILFRLSTRSPSAELSEGDLELIVLLDDVVEREVSESYNLNRENSEYSLQELHSVVLMVNSVLMINTCITSFRHRIRSPSAELTEVDLNVIEFFENNSNGTRNEFFSPHEDPEESPIEEVSSTSEIQGKTRRFKALFGLFCSKNIGKKRSCVIL